MIQYLCYCRFDMVDSGLEESKPVDNVFNWFFRMLEKTGCYPIPKGYKSYREKQIEAEKELIARREKEITELRELAQKRLNQERDAEFWAMMAAPEFRKCFERLNDFSKSRAKKGGKAFEDAMRKAFDDRGKDGESGACLKY